jgi:Zn-dependent membrane protease YugP
MEMPFFFYDSSYMLFVLPALLFAMYAQSTVNSTFARFLRVRARSGLTGAEAARRLLDEAGLDQVRIERVNRRLGDHYDPRAKVLRLSPEVYDNPSLASLGVAAHETGHAIQHDVGYIPLSVRNTIVPVAQIGSQAAFPLFRFGLFFNLPGLLDLGILLFGAAVLFQIVTLPVEFNASSRAIALLESGGIISGAEVGPTRQVLSAAALTYVAATAVAVGQLLRLLMLRGRRD